MMTKEYALHEVPTQEELSIVKQWIYEEYLLNNRQFGFYCNWNLIEKGFEEQRVIIFSFEDKPLGLVLWSEYDGYVDIDIFVIAPSQRGLGLGNIFAEMLSRYFQEKEMFALKLFCSPKESVSFWRDKLGFIQYPDRGYSESSLTFYKTLIPITPCTDILDTPYRLELWDVEEYLATCRPPRWVWNIESDLKRYPIIQPCNCNWNIRLINNNTIVKEDKVKYFGYKSYYYERGDFLYIDNLNIY